MSFTRRLLGLISEPAFIRFTNIQTEPNIFRIVGRAHYERWHSAFWGWLLDAQGSHLLGDYVLTRFLYLLFDERCLTSNHQSNEILLTAVSTATFSDIEVIPNEYVSTETSVNGVGRFDIFLNARYTNRTAEDSICW